MKKLLLLALTFTCLGSFIQAQEWEYGVFIGPAQYQGDLSKAQITWPKTRFQGGALARLNLNSKMAVKFGFYAGRVTGADKFWGEKFDGGVAFQPQIGNSDNTHNYYWRKKRNLDFFSNIFELTAHFEYNLMKFIPGSPRYRWTPYLLAGFSAFHFNPKTTLNGTTYKLVDYRTEYEKIQKMDQGKKAYSLFSFAIPTGIGIKYNLGRLWTVAFEIAGRKTFTDYLDDVHFNFPYNPAGGTAQVTIGSIDAQLADRRTEALDPKGNAFKAYDFSRAPATTKEVRRGDPRQMDTYIFTGFTLTKTIRKYVCASF